MNRITSITTILSIAAAVALAACSRDEVSFDTLETARATAKENAVLAANGLGVRRG